MLRRGSSGSVAGKKNGKQAKGTGRAVPLGTVSSTAGIEEEMKRQCIDLKQEIYNKWETNIMSKSMFSPSPGARQDSSVRNRILGVHAIGTTTNVEPITAPLADTESTEQVGPLDDADSDGSDDEGEEAPPPLDKEDSVLSMTHSFIVRDNSRGGSPDEEDLDSAKECVQDEQMDMTASEGSAGTTLLGQASTKVLPSKSVSRSAIPPRHAPMKLEESVVPPVSPIGDPIGDPIVEPGSASPDSAPVSPGSASCATTPPAPPPRPGLDTAVDEEVTASTSLSTGPEVPNARVLSPPLPLYNFKSPVKPSRIPNAESGSGELGGWCPPPPKTGINVPMIYPAPFHLRYVPPKGEPLYIKPEQLVSNMLLKDAERFSKPDGVRNRVVFDSIEGHHSTGASNSQPVPAMPAFGGGGVGGGTSNHTRGGVPKPVQLPPYYQVTGEEDETLIFESRFESGNLRRAIQIYEREYDLIIKPDINTRGHTQWFYFAVSNVRAGKKYKFNCINLYKGDSLYNRGMQPLMYSLRDAKETKTGWVRRGEDICYYQNHIKRRGGHYYTATFTVEFPYDDDTVYLAYCFPYTYTDLKRYLHALEQDPKRRNRFRRRPLCQTLAGNTCDLLTITSFACDANSLRARKGVVVTARVHPGESNSSYMMKGVIDYLTGPSLDAKILRDNFVFKVVPMLNPDGVIVGNYRCSLAGVDLNRNWDNPSRKLHPTIYYTKNMIRRFMEDRDVILFTDFHGHSRKMNVFMYGCEDKRPKMRLRERIFPRILWKNSSIFSFADCSFNIGKQKESTGRVVGHRELGLANSYTMEASFCGADFGRRAERHFTVAQLEEMGHYFCDTILDYCDPDQSKVQNTLRELQVLNPNGMGSNALTGAVPSALAGDDSDGDGDNHEECDSKTKKKKGGKVPTNGSMGGRKGFRQGSKASMETKHDRKVSKKGDDGKAKPRVMRRRASLPSTKAEDVTQSKGKTKARAGVKAEQLSVEQALAQADAVLAKMAGASSVRPSSASHAMETAGPADSLLRLEHTVNTRRVKAKKSVTAAHRNAGAATAGGGSHLAQAGRAALHGWGLPNK